MKLILASLLIFVTTLARAEEKPMSLIDRAKDAFTRLDRDHLDVVDQFYDKDLEFHDPIGTIRGRDKMKAYYLKMYQDLKSIKFEYIDAIQEGQKVVLVWKMTYSTEKLNDGEPISIDGMSWIKFGGTENKVVYHRDYFDVGEMVYEHIPVLGWGVRKVKAKLGEH